MKKFKVAVMWTVGGSATIEAESPEQAAAIADKMLLSSFNDDYMVDSFDVIEVEEI